MTKVQRVIGLAAAFMLMVGLSACAPGDGEAATPDQVVEFTVTLDDGTQVPCIRIRSLHGFACNFDKAIRSSPLPKP